MAFVVENGTGISNANSYASVAYYRTYWTERGRDVSAQTEAQIQAYLIRATDFIEKTFGDRWRGTRSTIVQSLGFPREGVVIDGISLPSDMLPSSLLMATAEYGYRASLYADPTLASNTWAMPSYPAADLLLRPLLTGGGRGRTIRA